MIISRFHGQDSYYIALLKKVLVVGCTSNQGSYVGHSNCVEILCRRRVDGAAHRRLVEQIFTLILQVSKSFLDRRVGRNGFEMPNIIRITHKNGPD